ncbi:hypothetical protein CENSYa_0225 [Cenarchaeum symbiosum A]|uniref:Uncharacterized protein n=1 Tax=Cenarchaeum symbiosum (strain A) TaxID=414004 RepID=A0RU51_CENSY|nr:hypothetical protein CENSYa_0225 [Cenarchaeum symbiosum A]
MTNPQWGHEYIESCFDCSLSICLPETDLMRTISELETTAKFLPSPIESRNSLMAVITSVLSTGSSSMGESTNSWSFTAGMAATLSETYMSSSCFMDSTSLQSTVIMQVPRGSCYFSLTRCLASQADLKLWCHARRLGRAPPSAAQRAPRLKAPLLCLDAAEKTRLPCLYDQSPKLSPGIRAKVCQTAPAGQPPQRPCYARSAGMPAYGLVSVMTKVRSAPSTVSLSVVNGFSSVPAAGSISTGSEQLAATPPTAIASATRPIPRARLLFAMRGFLSLIAAYTITPPTTFIKTGSRYHALEFLARYLLHSGHLTAP